MLRRSFTILPLSAALPRRAAAQAFPDRPVTLVVPYAPGGSADVLARVLGPAMAEQLGQPVVVELRPGAGGNIGAVHVAKAAPADGYSLLLASISLSTGPALSSTMGLDPSRDLVPVCGIGAIPSLAVVSPTSPLHGIQEVIAAAKARPGQVSFGSSGLATGSHLAGEQLAAAAAIQLLHVPYRGSGAVYPDLIAGRIDLLLDVMGSSIGQVQAGAVRAIGITSLRRSAALPAVATFAEQGLDGFEFATWFGFFARRGTPDAALARLEAASLHALAMPQVQQRLTEAAAQPIPARAAAFGTWFDLQLRRWQDLVARGQLARLD